MRHIDELVNSIQVRVDELEKQAQEITDQAFVNVSDKDFYQKLDERYEIEPHVHSMEFLRQT